MKYRKLGQTGLEVSEIGFGAWGIGGVADGAPAYGRTDDQESITALRRAYELGVTYFDTAALYGLGHSEVLLGAALKDVRHQVVIGTKVGLLSVDGAKDFSVDHIEHSLEQSLKRLQTDYVDLYQLHGPSISVLEADNNILSALSSLQQKGKIRAFGISVDSPDDGLAAISKFGFNCIQVNFNLADQRALENGLFGLAGQKRVGIIVRTPLCFGFLTGAYPSDSEFEPGDHRSSWSSNQIEQWAGASQLFSTAVANRKQTDAQFALRFCLSHPSVSTAIPGMLTREHVEENLLASDLGPLPEAGLRQLEKIYSEHTFFVGR